MRRHHLLVGLCLGLAVVGSAPSARAMTAPEIVRLLDAGIGEAVILDQVRVEGIDARLSSEEILSLKQAGASDDFLRALIRAGSESASTRGEVTASRGELEDEWTESYRSPIQRVEIYYDPFGYYWYSWPAAYAYYDPFRWLDCGFYYAGWWDHRWWRYGPYCDHYRGLYWHWEHPRPDPSRVDRGRHSWTRASRDEHPRIHRPAERDRGWGRDRGIERSRDRSVRPGSELRPRAPQGADRRSDRGAPGRSGGGRSDPSRSGWKR